MKSVALLILLALSSQIALAADDKGNLYRAPTSFAGKTVVLPIGTEFEGRIQSTIGSKQSRSGDSFSIQISAPVMANGTDVLIPSGSEVLGEVAEAISSNSQPHDKGMKFRPLGILRVQLSSLKLADGMSYPLVASFAGDASRSHRRGGDMTVRKSTVAYVGTQAGFDAANPVNSTKNKRYNNGVLSKGEMMRDPIMGEGMSNNNNNRVVRSLQRSGRDLVILSGSSITIRLDAPLKIAFGASNAQASMQSEEPEETGKTRSGGKHFSKTRSTRKKQENATGDNGGDTANGGNQNNNYNGNNGNNASGNYTGGNNYNGGNQNNGGNNQPTQKQPGSDF